LLQLKFTCSEAGEKAAFPMQYSEYTERSDFCLLEPIAGRLKAGQPTRFTLDCPSVPEIAIIQGSTWLRLKRNEKTLFEGIMTPTAGAPVIIATPGADNRWSSALEYEVAD
jgi:hypothetical protein